MTIYLVMSRHGTQPWGTEVWRRSESAAEQWIRDHRLQMGGMEYRVVPGEFQEHEVPRSERPARVR